MPSREVWGPFVRCFLAWSDDTGPEASNSAAAIAVLAGEGPGLGVSPNQDNRLLAMAVATGREGLREAVATWNMWTLGRTPEALAWLVERLDGLSSEALRNFLVATYKVTYPRKEAALLALLDPTPTDLIVVEAVVAGLCNCNTHTSLEAVATLADAKVDEERQVLSSGELPWVRRQMRFRP